MKRQSEKEQTLQDNARLLRAWKRWHREQLEEALCGLHRDALERLMLQLKNLQSARELIGFIEAQNWAVIDADTRFTGLHEINAAITALRERNGLAPIDDPLPSAPENAFRIIKTIMGPVSRYRRES
jgi:hypothetical protein